MKRERRLYWQVLTSCLASVLQIVMLKLLPSLDGITGELSSSTVSHELIWTLCAIMKLAADDERLLAQPCNEIHRGNETISQMDSQAIQNL